MIEPGVNSSIEIYCFYSKINNYSSLCQILVFSMKSLLDLGKPPVDVILQENARLV